MEGQPRDIIRAIRRALGMSQAQFARALGWAPSTISRWESGRAEPDRLALKLILAFGEERRVRYRPRRELETRLALPVPHDLPTQRQPTVLSSSVPLEVTPHYTRSVSIAAERSGWEAELNLRLALRRRGLYPERRRRSWLRKAAIIGASACVAAAIGVPLITRSSPAPARPTLETAPMPTPPAVAVPPQPAGPAATVASSDAVRPQTLAARLEAVTVLGGMRQATFRTPTETVTVAEGDQLGAQRAAHIGSGGVDLADSSGQVRTVKLGDRIALE